MKAFKMAWHIISTSPEEEESFQAVSRVMCEECQEHHFFDDGDELKG